MLSEERQIDNFNNVGNSYSIWHYYAENLLLSSKFLYDEYIKVDLKRIKEQNTPPGQGMRLLGVIKMLRAMTLECLFKALWLKKGGLLAVGGKCKQITGSRLEFPR